MFDSAIPETVRSQRRQPTRLPCPWDSPGKNTGVGCHFLLQCMKVKNESEVAQLCLTLHNPMDCSLLGSSIHGIFQARVLEWVAVAFSEKQPKLGQMEKKWGLIALISKIFSKRIRKKPTCGQSLSHVWFFVTLWTVAPQAPLSMGFSRQEYWSELPFHSPG